eukprot:TRINITY_DN12764_c0_g1_i2.p1 TRINITY_DN12764_c0_g1~~TRINITY_DN12764_c0_g1_i2.p1  ORF type:complete len:242 (+),score=31.39 TRINITY_DN12764_c0_g1_i2:44-727(+)
MATITVSRKIQLPNPMLVSSDIPTIKLTYFNLRARAEPARLLLAYAGVSYEDDRLPLLGRISKNGLQRRLHIPMAVFPCSTWGGKEIAQSLAITRFLATKFGLAGRDNLESAQVDEIIHALQDVINSGYAVLHEKDEKKKGEMAAKHKEETIPTVLANIEKRLTSRGGQFLVGNTLTWADIQTFFFCSELCDQDVLKNVPAVANLVARIGTLPNIKAWVETRPSNPF